MTRSELISLLAEKHPHLTASDVVLTRVLKDKGYLEIDSAGKSSVSKLVPGIGRMRVYVIKASLMQTVGDGSHQL